MTLTPGSAFAGSAFPGQEVASAFDPLYIQAAALVAQAWPVQALFESLRRGVRL